MTVKEAMHTIKSKYTDMSVVECFELPDFYAFGMVEKGAEHETAAGGLFTVEKVGGKIGSISPVCDYEIFSKAKPIDINTLN